MVDLLEALEHVPAKGQPDPTRLRAFTASPPGVAAAFKLREQVQAAINSSKTENDQGKPGNSCHSDRYIPR
jgi:hypothetical protein